MDRELEDMGDKLKTGQDRTSKLEWGWSHGQKDPEVNGVPWVEVERMVC